MKTAHLLCWHDKVLWWHRFCVDMVLCWQWHDKILGRHRFCIDSFCVLAVTWQSSVVTRVLYWQWHDKVLWWHRFCGDSDMTKFCVDMVLCWRDRIPTRGGGGGRRRLGDPLPGGWGRHWRGHHTAGTPGDGPSGHAEPLPARDNHSRHLEDQDRRAVPAEAEGASCPGAERWDLGGGGGGWNGGGFECGQRSF